jgi:hypothetical protein
MNYNRWKRRIKDARERRKSGIDRKSAPGI